MNTKTIVILIIVITLAVSGFFIYKNLYQPNQSTEEEGNTPVDEEIIPTGEESSAPAQEKPPAKSEAPSTSPKTATPKSSNPVDSLSDALIAKWGVNCKSKGSLSAIASCILDWQESSIFWCYIHPEAQSYFDYFSPDYPDCVVDMQFQQMSPGLFPVSKVMELKVRNGKIFGACYTYATTFCAVARWHGLTCRVMEAKTTLSFYSASSGDYAEGYCGSAPKSFLDKLGQSCEDWRMKDWKMDADHYWAEILIDGQWQIMERPLWAYRQDTTKYIIQAGRNYGDTGW